MYCLGILLYGCFATSVLSCFVERDYLKPMSYLLKISDIVVYGEDLEHIEVNTSMELIPTAVNSLFRVYCILKSDGKEINENITIETIKPRSSCSDTWHEIGDKVILSLRRLESGNFEWHEVNKLQSAAFEGSEDNFNKTTYVLNSKKWKPPSDSEVNMCPMKYMAMEGVPKSEDIRSDSEDKQAGLNNTDSESDSESAPIFEDNSPNTGTIISGSNETNFDNDSKNASNSEDKDKNLDQISSETKQADSDSGSNPEHNLEGQKASSSISDRNLSGQILPSMTFLILAFISVWVIDIK